MGPKRDRRREKPYRSKLLEEELSRRPPEEPPAPKRAYRHKLSREERSEIARRAAAARIPTEPHPDNLKLLSSEYPRRFDGLPLGDWLRQRLERAATRKNPRASYYAWCGWLTTCEQLEKRVADCARHPTNQPISAARLAQAQLLLADLKRDLEDNRPF